MPKKTSGAVKEFRTRCEGALVILEMRWNVIQLLATHQINDEAFFASEWKRGVKFVTEVFGADATEVALQALQSNQKAN